MRLIHCRIFVLAIGIACSCSVMAQDDDTSLSCLSMNLVRSAGAVDDRTLLFELRNGTRYLSRLDQDCPGLARNNRFSYNLRTGARIPRLCHTDTITVIEPTGDGFVCGLGRFELLSEARLEQLQRDASEPPVAVEIIEIELTEPDVEPAAGAEPGVKQEAE